MGTATNAQNNWITGLIIGIVSGFVSGLTVYFIVDFVETRERIHNHIGAYKHAEALFHRGLYEESLALAEKTINRISRIDELDQYGDFCHLKGFCYFKLSKRNDRERNLQQSIRTYEEALKCRSELLAPLKRMKTLNNLGMSLSNLAEIRNKHKNLKASIKAYEDALNLPIASQNTFMHNTVTSNLCVSYMRLSEVRDKKKNLAKALNLYKSLMKKNPQLPKKELADWNQNMGIGERCLFEVSGEKRHLDNSITLLKKSLDYFQVEKDPIDYALASWDLGKSYERLMEIDPSREIAIKEVTLLLNAIEILSTENSFDNANILNDLAIAYLSLSRFQSPALNIQKAEYTLTKVLSRISIAKHPLIYAKTRHNLGTVKYQQYRVLNDKSALDSSISLFNDALRIRTLSDYPLDHAETQLVLYSIIREEGYPSTNSLDSIFGGVIQVYTEKEYPYLHKKALEIKKNMNQSRG